MVRFCNTKSHTNCNPLFLCCDNPRRVYFENKSVSFSFPSIIAPLRRKSEIASRRRPIQLEIKGGRSSAGASTHSCSRFSAPDQIAVERGAKLCVCRRQKSRAHGTDVTPDLVIRSPQVNRANERHFALRALAQTLSATLVITPRVV